MCCIAETLESLEVCKSTEAGFLQKYLHSLWPGPAVTPMGLDKSWSSGLWSLKWDAVSYLPFCGLGQCKFHINFALLSPMHDRMKPSETNTCAKRSH